jgi:hypothetical protein
MNQRTHPDGNVVRHEQFDGGLRDTFLAWQCRVRQIAMRSGGGRPSDGMMPLVTPHGASEPLGHVIVLLNKAPEFSKVPEFRHMYRRTMDPAQRRESALKFLSEMYYQSSREFMSTLTATFAPQSAGAERIVEAEGCRLDFEQYNQRFTLDCRVWEPRPGDFLFAATFWHNSLFNPNLPRDTRVLAFEPDWAESTAEPSPRK